jgi:ribose transport system substrate-binding protein
MASRRRLIRGAAETAVLGGLASILGSKAFSAENVKAAAIDSPLIGNGEVYPVVYWLTSLSYWNMHFAGFSDIGKLLNISFKKLGPTDSDIAQQVLVLEQTIASKPPGIVVGAIDDVVTGKSIDKAIDAGIPVITMDGPAWSSKQMCYVGTGNIQAGYTVGQRIVKAIGEGNVIVSTTQTGAPAKLQRLQGFKQALEETGGKVKIATIVEDNDRAEKAVTSIGQALQAHPDAKAVFTISAGAGLGTAQAVRQAGKTDMPVYAFGNDDAAYRLTKEQNLTMVAQDGYKMGYMCGLLIHIIAKGLIAPRYNFKSLGESPLPPIVDTGVNFVSKENADAFIGCRDGC